MQKIGTTGDGKSAVATPDGKKPKEEEEEVLGLFWDDLKKLVVNSNFLKKKISLQSPLFCLRSTNSQYISFLHFSSPIQ